MLAENICAARLSAGLTQYQLGEMVGVSNITIAGYENNRRQPRVDILEKIATACNVSLDFLITGQSSDNLVETKIHLGSPNKDIADFLKSTQIIDRLGTRRAAILDIFRFEYTKNEKALREVDFLFVSLTAEQKKTFLNILSALASVHENIQPLSENMDAVIKASIKTLSALMEPSQ
jgi:transcriptional regulator with XRE-family HTH domain